MKYRTVQERRRASRAAVARELPHTCYRVTLYHDEPTEASADERTTNGHHTALADAVEHARRMLSDYWQTASVDRYEHTPGRPGIMPDLYAIDLDRPAVRVGPDWID